VRAGFKDLTLLHNFDVPKGNIIFPILEQEARRGVGNPVQRGHRFQRKADGNPVIADSR
jgi:hypothetical protein